MAISFNDIVKGSVFNREDFDALLDKHGPVTIKEELLELQTSLKAQLLNKQKTTGSDDWERKVKTIMVYVDRRLSQVNQIIKSENIQDSHQEWKAIALELATAIFYEEAQSTLLDGMFLPGSGRTLMDFMETREEGNYENVV